jgi:hypothetical protein
MSDGGPIDCKLDCWQGVFSIDLDPMPGLTVSGAMGLPLVVSSASDMLFRARSGLAKCGVEPPVVMRLSMGTLLLDGCTAARLVDMHVVFDIPNMLGVKGSCHSRSCRDMVISGV